jgi:hypothetical protein
MKKNSKETTEQGALSSELSKGEQRYKCLNAIRFIVMKLQQSLLKSRIRSQSGDPVLKDRELP